MRMLEMLSDAEKRMLVAYIENYGFSGGNGGTMKTTIDHLLRFWDANKSKYLLDMFGGELIIRKDIVYKKSLEDLEDALNRVLFNYEAQGTPAYDFCKRFYDFGYENRYDFTREQTNAWSMLTYASTLATNEYTGETAVFATPDGKEIKVAHGCRATRVIGKLAKAYGLDENFEEFRLAHSQALNQKELKGTLCLSLHPMDYFTMSDNYCDWSSCMSWQENGCYRMGTVEMMNSPMVVVAYLASKDDMDVPCGQWNSKKWRELYIVNQDIITNVKAYPYKNENLTKEVIAWLKSLAESHGLGKYDEVPFFWNYNYQDDCDRLRGSGITLRIETNMMYNDFDSDAGQWSYLSENYPAGDYHWINYSGESVCVCCGRSDAYFDGEGDITCTDCEEVVYCDDCGERIYDGDDAYTVDGQTLCYGCYEHHTEECMYTEELHMRYNCMEVCVAWGKDRPVEDRQLRYDRGWCDRGVRPMKEGDVAFISGTKYYIYDDEFENAIEEYTKSNSYETVPRKYDKDALVLRVSDLTEKFAQHAGYDSLEGFIEDLKGREEWEIS